MWLFGVGCVITWNQFIWWSKSWCSYSLTVVNINYKFVYQELMPTLILKTANSFDVLQLKWFNHKFLNIILGRNDSAIFGVIQPIETILRWSKKQNNLKRWMTQHKLIQSLTNEPLVWQSNLHTCATKKYNFFLILRKSYKQTLERGTWIGLVLKESYHDSAWPGTSISAITLIPNKLIEL